MQTRAHFPGKLIGPGNPDGADGIQLVGIEKHFRLNRLGLGGLPKTMRTDTMHHIGFLRLCQGQIRHQVSRHLGALLRMTDPPAAFILTATADVVKKGRHRKNHHVDPFPGADITAQPIDPQGVLPVVASGLPVQQLLGHLPEVLHVWEDELRPLTTNYSAEFLGLFDNERGLRGPRKLDGEDIVIGVIDSGITPDHPSLKDTREADKPRICRTSFADTFIGLWLCRRFEVRDDVQVFDPPEDWNGACETGEEFDETDCNNKVIGARWFIDGAEASGPTPARMNTFSCVPASRTAAM